MWKTMLRYLGCIQMGQFSSSFPFASTKRISRYCIGENQQKNNWINMEIYVLADLVLWNHGNPAMAAKNHNTSNKHEAMKVSRWTWPTRACTWIWSQKTCTWPWPERTCKWPWPQRACTWGWPQGACTWSWPQGACTWSWPQVPANEDGYKEPASEVGHRGPAHELKLATKGLQMNLATQSLLKREAHVQKLAHTHTNGHRGPAGRHGHERPAKQIPMEPGNGIQHFLAHAIPTGSVEGLWVSYLRLQVWPWSPPGLSRHWLCPWSQSSKAWTPGAACRHCAVHESLPW